MGRTKRFWINAGLINLCIVAMLGFILRTKILFPINFIDYRNMLTAHGNFALTGWIGFVLMNFLVFLILPADRSSAKKYSFLFTLLFFFAWAMMLGYALAGPTKIALIFCFAYITTTYAFTIIYIRDILNTGISKFIKLLCIISLLSLVLASSGAIALALMYMGLWKIPVSYRDATYIFLHFQYNGFFTLAMGAVYLHFILQKTGSLPSSLKKSVYLVSIATIPSVFLSLLYYEKTSFYVIGIITGIMLLAGAYYFLSYLASKQIKPALSHSIARALWIMAAVSFILKNIMQVGTLTPIGHAVYSDRPVIIGFLHMVFLGFGSFFILGILANEGYFSRNQKLYKIPLLVFIVGVLLNETFLMIQGVEILLKTNNPLYNWLLWVAAIFLFCGALLIGVSRVLSDREK
jgi:hypothetical protein